MRTRQTLMDHAVERLASAGVANPRRNAEWMLCDILGCSKAALYAEPMAKVEEDRVRKFEWMLERRAGHEPLQYILGYTEFYGLRLAVTSDVLIPRPETEQVVEQALGLISNVASPRILDVGTGSGCIALAMKYRRGDAIVSACDVSSAALGVARKNAAENDVEVAFFLADALSDDFLETVPDGLDLLVSNPPYVTEAELETLPRDVREHEPHLALIAPRDPVIFYRKLSDAGQTLLNPGGWIMFETHADFGRDSEEVLMRAGYEQIELRKDYAGRSRILFGRKPDRTGSD